MNVKNLNKIFDQLFPICRSITGNGYSRSLQILKKYINFKILKYRSGKKVLDWITPNEWNISDAYVSKNNKKIIDFKKNNLHIVSYSQPLNKTIGLNKLQEHLYSIKKYPKLIPYVTSHYNKNWGFCLEHEKRAKLKKGSYKVVIKSNFTKGYVRNGLAKLTGKKDKIILLSSYLCHPSMANNELSGPLVMLGLYEKIKRWKKRNFNYYFLINPETIGSICFLNSHKNILKKKLQSGLVLTCLGGPQNKLSYKKSRLGNSTLDRLFEYLNKKKFNLIRNFSPTDGSDERQYCSSEMNLPVGQIARTIYGQYHQYHTSGDNKKFMNINQIAKSIDQLENVLRINDNIFPLKRFIPYGELQLGRRGLYPNLNTSFDKTHKNEAENKNINKRKLKILLYLLSYADGKHDILNIANITNFSLKEIVEVLQICLDKKLIKI
tara:strand:- start:6749 stop:8056 length:1308 start_codon:yes stop_codon:yes gene_type:complete